MKCEDARSLMHGYMDGELDAVSNSAVEEHLTSCQSCQAEVEAFHALSTRLRDDALYYQPSADLLDRVFSTAEADSPGKTPTIKQYRRFTWQPWALAATLAICCFFAGRTLRNPQPAAEVVMQEVVGSHVRSLMGAHLMDIASTDQHTVKPWFDGKLDFAPPIERLDGTEFLLIGGRLDYIDGHSAAASVYRHRKHIINLFIWPSSVPDPSMHQWTYRGYNVVQWTSHNMTSYAVSDTATSDLLTFARLIQAHGG